jgi:hypothetical protein
MKTRERAELLVPNSLCMALSVILSRFELLLIEARVRPIVSNFKFARQWRTNEREKEDQSIAESLAPKLPIDGGRALKKRPG